MTLNTNRQSMRIGTFIFLMIFGGIFTAMGVFAYTSSRINETWTRTQGIIVDIKTSKSDDSTTYSPVVEYQVGGETFTAGSNFSTSAYPTIGGNKEVAYNPNNPAQGKVVEGKGFDMFLLAFPAIGILVIFGAIAGLISSIKRSKEIERLMSQGRKVEGVLVEVQSLSNENSSYRIVVSAPSSMGGVKNYVSDIVGGVGGLMMADYRNNPIPIDVYIDPMNEKSYYVDISDIPNLTPERIGQLVEMAKTRMTFNGTTTNITQGESIS